ncbi:hypothetical protein SLEP1_g36774 [Rubroshorea leprosula]|uniref:Uncharacterized protein n=1 Tax=Rubroshorea leprosula TaxID=152421 RepID=A0AAV5KT17_9ROSI|nr:hypothetical protein SLEP1_g36774 [Rubroshorea leprosula]
MQLHPCAWSGIVFGCSMLLALSLAGLFFPSQAYFELSPSLVQIYLKKLTTSTFS